MHAHVCAHTHTHAHAHIHTSHMHTHITHAHTHTSHMHTCTCIQTTTHTHTHTHTHSLSLSVAERQHGEMKCTDRQASVLPVCRPGRLLSVQVCPLRACGGGAALPVPPGHGEPRHSEEGQEGEGATGPWAVPALQDWAALLWPYCPARHHPPQLSSWGRGGLLCGGGSSRLAGWRASGIQMIFPGVKMIFCQWAQGRWLWQRGEGRTALTPRWNHSW